jgi:parallel beta-helix repeat protein
MKNIVSGAMVALLLASLLTFAFNFSVSGNENNVLIEETSDSILLRCDFVKPVVRKSSDYDSVEISNLPKYGSPGEPILPFKLVKVLIPQGKDVQDVDVRVGKKIFLGSKFKIDYGKAPLPTSSNFTLKDLPKSEIYNSVNPFPETLFTILSDQFLRGYEIFLLKLYPVQFVPKTGELYYFESMTVTITLEETGEISPIFRNLPQDRELVMSMVDNPNEVRKYIPTVTHIQPKTSKTLSSYNYVIITSNALKSSFQPLVDWKFQKGLSATIVLVEDILSNPNYHCNGLFGDGYGTPKFNDTQAHIRNFIKDAYQNWGTEYVLLGGDDEIIPVRGVYGYAGYSFNESGIEDYNIPCDMYYGALDGSWDKDNDTIFGESTWHTRSWPGAENGTAGEEADFFAEVYIGRATVDTPQEVENFVNKTLAYEKDSQADYLKKILMIGQKLDDVTEGGNTEDLVTDIISQYTATRLYTRDETFNISAVINELNNGVHIVCHHGHSNPTGVMGLLRSDVDSLSNTEYFLVYSLGCSSAAFDEAKGGPNDAIGEHFVSATGGAFAYIGNSRYGFYCPASLDGPSDRYEISFFSVLNSGIRNLGKVLQLSKEQEPILDRWIYFTLNLLGDPETEIITEIKAPTAHFETRTDLLAPPRIGGLVSIRGTAKRSLAPDSTFENFIIEFGEGTNPTSWMTTGITLTNNGESEIINETLATWDTTQLTSGTYTLRLTVFDIEDQVGEDRRTVCVTPDAVPIYIRDDGSIDPSTSPIQRNVDVYTLTDNIFSSSDGIVILRDNILLDGAGYMILGSGKEGVGIRLSERNNITVKNIEIREHCYGIYIEKSSEITISYSNLVSNTHGIYLSESSDNSIIENNVTDNYDGISLLSSSNNNEIVGNRIMSNLGFFGSGLYVYISSNNHIYHNTFADNAMQVYDAVWDCSDPGLISPSLNIWDNGYPGGGNYWNDYDGLDLYRGPYQNETESDGVGDTPYIVDAQNKDHYPLMNPWVHPDVAVLGISTSRNMIGQGFALNATVLVMTIGDKIEEFKIFIYANSSLIDFQSFLYRGNPAYFTFTCNTSSLPMGNYTISAYALPVPSEIDTTDNNCTGGWMLITEVSDLGGGMPPQFLLFDGVVDGKDKALFLLCYKGTAPPEAMYLGDLGGGTPPQFFKCDGKVDGKDKALFLLCYKGLGP